MDWDAQQKNRNTQIEELQQLPHWQACEGRISIGFTWAGVVDNAGPASLSAAENPFTWMYTFSNSNKHISVLKKAYARSREFSGIFDIRFD
ncbi:hypothetical protein FISHEDRAFT_69657 [Fistulina hepatica ATCC 64428]|uniref:Uncharacterized protein n=1 Tax=Fistulina hepatica ATCC 64428 TaxID=1128425 RepID=A0A0D7AM22_9AGAR|nr:hypothetical protein FISHEDRAFT_69657 [Fistulina hepatica ATCC 64428]